jgi:hypothetical protein
VAGGGECASACHKRSGLSAHVEESSITTANRGSLPDTTRRRSTPAQPLLPLALAGFDGGDACRRRCVLITRCLGVNGVRVYSYCCVQHAWQRGRILRLYTRKVACIT